MSRSRNEKTLFVRAEEVCEMLSISRPYAYRLISGWNEELRQLGYTVISGRCPRSYMENKIYGLRNKK